MLYPVLTVAAGTVMAAVSLVSLVLCIRSGGIFISQARFLISGILLALHFPLITLLGGLILPLIEQVGPVEGSDTAAYWLAMGLLVTVQMIVLPTRAELYATYVADRLARAR